MQSLPVPCNPFPSRAVPSRPVQSLPVPWSLPCPVDSVPSREFRTVLWIPYHPVDSALFRGFRVVSDWGSGLRDASAERRSRQWDDSRLCWRRSAADIVASRDPSERRKCDSSLPPCESVLLPPSSRSVSPPLPLQPTAPPGYRSRLQLCAFGILPLIFETGALLPSS